MATEMDMADSHIALIAGTAPSLSNSYRLRDYTKSSSYKELMNKNLLKNNFAKEFDKVRWP